MLVAKQMSVYEYIRKEATGAHDLLPVPYHNPHKQTAEQYAQEHAQHIQHSYNVYQVALEDERATCYTIIHNVSAQQFITYYHATAIHTANTLQNALIAATNDYCKRYS